MSTQVTISENTVQLKAYAKVDTIHTSEEGHTGLPVLVQVVAPSGRSVRAPIDLIAVLDVSCCCEALAPGPGNRTDLLNRAMEFVINKLNSQDRLAIIATPTVAEKYNLLAMTADGQKEATAHMKSLAASGGNKLSTALDKATAILDGRNDEEKRKKAGFIILISDGDDNSIFGETLSPRYPVHSFGFRDTHNARVMHYIANSSTGTYCILNDEHNQITDAFVASINNIASIVAVDVKIDITCSGSEATLTAIESGGFKYHIEDGGKTGFINAGSLPGGAARSFIFCVDYAHGKAYDELPKLLSVNMMSGRPCDAESRAEETKKGEVILVRKGEVGSRKVAAEIVRLHAVRIVRGTLGRYGRKGLTGAVAKLREQWTNLRDNTEYGREAGEASLLSGLDAEMEDMFASMHQGSGLLSMVSWLTRHTLQHLTASSAPLATPETPVAVDAAMASGAGCASGREKRRREHYTEMGMIERRMAYWSKVLCGLPPMHKGECPDHTAMALQEVSRGSIVQAMHQDIYLAVMNATERRGHKSCECSCCPATETLNNGL